MSHRKKTGITLVLSIFICLLGLLASIFGSFRYAMRDQAIETLAKEWELSQMQITKIADRMSMAQFFVVMVMTPEIDAEGAERLLDAEYTRDFIAGKIKAIRDDLLYKTGEGQISFADIAKLEKENRDAVTEDLRYSVTTEDMERYEITWDNLGLGDRFTLGIYREHHPTLFAVVGALMSNWFLILTALSTIAAGAGLWFLNGRSFSGHRIYGVALLIVGVADCALALSHGLLADAVNRFINMRSNVMDLFFAPVGQMFLILGGILFLLGVISVLLFVWDKRRSAGPRL